MVANCPGKQRPSAERTGAIRKSLLWFIVFEEFEPAHPGELIRETIEGLREETGKRLTIEEVAKGLTTTRKTLSAIINGKQSVTPEMALKLAKAFNTSPEFWLHAQENYDLALARKKTDVAKIKLFRPNFMKSVQTL